MRKWKKLGNIFCPKNHASWLVSHAANPVAEVLENGVVRIYFTGRDKDNRSHIGSAEFDFRNNFRVLSISSEPLVEPGFPGLFDDSGAAMGCLVKKDGVRWLYYLGWNLKVTVPWMNTVGLAKEENGLFRKVSDAPVVDRSHNDPYSISYPFVLEDEGKWKMWYGSNLEWGKEQHQMMHVIKYAESTDGIHWDRNGHIAISLEHAGEYAIAKPMVIRDADTYSMWYSYRANGEVKSYRIGYATSEDGINWMRKDNEAGIDVSAEGWDSEMIEYGHVFDFDGKRYMLYNGNGFGLTGFGLAIQE